MRLADLLATFSLATDAGMGMPMEHGLRAATVAVRVGEITGASDADRRDAFHLALLRYIGCTADSDLAASVMGDEVAVRGMLYGVDWGAPAEIVSRLASAVARGKGPVQAAFAVARTLSKMPKLLDSGTSHCEVADRLAERIGFARPFRQALFQTFERWDGRGWPRRLRGDAIALPMRLAQIGELIELAHRLGGVDAAKTIVKKRQGREIAPRLAEAFLSQADAVCLVLEVKSAWMAALEAEPQPQRMVIGEEIDEVLRALGDFADLKSRFMRTHSSGVARLASQAARQMRVTEDEQRVLARAALVHDIGRVATSAAIWDKPGPLTDPEWEQVRLHTYVGERILSRAEGLASIAEVAMLAHERVDGSGYHRRLAGSACMLLGRILAASDVYQAMTEDRPQRPALTPDEAAKNLSSMARDGMLCPDAVAGVLSVAGHAPPPRPRAPGGLTEREVAVLRLVARGMTNKEVAVALDISAKTAGNHIQNIFEKLGVTTRSAATMFAMQKGIVG